MSLKCDQEVLPDILISIITVVYNSCDGVGATIESIIPHLDNDVEYIIIDGGSTDGTVGVIENYSRYITRWRSESDEGIYDAMNKAAELSRGRFLLHINVGDYLISLPKKSLRSAPADVACVAFSVRLDDGQCFIPKVGIGLNYHNTLHHQGCFYRREIVRKYDLQYRVFSDYDLNLDIKRRGLSFITCESVVSHHEQQGISNTTDRFNEVYRIVGAHGGMFWIVVSFVYFKMQGIVKRLWL